MNDAFPGTTATPADARKRWHEADWDALVQLGLQELTDNADRARLALLVASAHQMLGNDDAARAFAAAALRWGCSKALAARVLLTGVHDALAVAAAASGDEERSTLHFRQAAELAGDAAGASASVRSMRELARAGLLAEAVQALRSEVDATRLPASAPSSEAARLHMLQTELDLLQGHVINMQQRNQFALPGPAAGDRRTGLAQRSVSQLGQDLWVLEQTKYKRNGYFVEFGASDGVLLSNTYLLESSFDWRGVCAEPNPKLFAELQRHRRCTVSDACIGAESGQDVEFILADVYGGIADTAFADDHGDKRAAYRSAGAVQRMRTVSLHDFLTAHGAPGHIDYLSIDTEGSEYRILEAFPFDAWQIDLITVEHNFSAQRDDIRRLLEAHGYTRTECRWDDWYSLLR